MNSNSYSLLEEQFNVLINKIPKFEDVDKLPIMEFEEKEKDMYTLVVILSHAEIENYLEDIGREIVNKSEKKYLTSGEIDKELGHLMFRMCKNTNFNKEIQKHTTKKLNNYIKNIKLIYFEKVLDENSGICSEKVKWIFKSIGKEKIYEEFYNNTFINISDLKSKRGSFVHKSTRHRIRNEINPKELYNNLKLIISEIKTFDHNLISE